MAIILSDPRYQALDQAGLALGKRLAQDQLERGQQAQTQTAAGIWGKALKAAPTQADTDAYIQANGLNRFIGLTPGAIVTASKQDWSAPGATVEQKQAAHAQANWGRALGSMIGSDLTGYGADDPLKSVTPDFGSQGLLGPYISKQDELQQFTQPVASLVGQPAPVNQPSGLFGSTVLRVQPRAITFEDIDRADGGKHSAALKKQAQERLDKGLNDGSLLMDVYSRMVDAKISPEIIAAVLQLGGSVADKMNKARRLEQATILAGEMIAEPDEVKRARKATEIYGLVGDGYGFELAKSMAPKSTMVQTNLEDRVEYDQITQPNALGMGEPGIKALGSKPIGISAAQRKALEIQSRHSDAAIEAMKARYMQDNGVALRAGAGLPGGVTQEEHQRVMDGIKRWLQRGESWDKIEAAIRNGYSDKPAYAEHIIRSYQR